MARTIFESWRKPVPPDYVEVHRWADAAELASWRSSPTRIPPDLATSERVYVMLPGAPPPGAAGQYRIEFCMPASMLRPAGHRQWRQIFGPVANAPIVNLRIVRP